MLVSDFVMVSDLVGAMNRVYQEIVHTGQLGYVRIVNGQVAHSLCVSTGPQLELHVPDKKAGQLRVRIKADAGSPTDETSQTSAPATAIWDVFNDAVREVITAKQPGYIFVSDGEVHIVTTRPTQPHLELHKRVDKRMLVGIHG